MIRTFICLFNAKLSSKSNQELGRQPSNKIDWLPKYIKITSTTFKHSLKSRKSSVQGYQTTWLDRTVNLLLNRRQRLVYKVYLVAAQNSLHLHKFVSVSPDHQKLFRNVIFCYFSTVSDTWLCLEEKHTSHITLVICRKKRNLRLHFALLFLLS